MRHDEQVLQKEDHRCTEERADDAAATTQPDRRASERDRRQRNQRVLKSEVRVPAPQQDSQCDPPDAGKQAADRVGV